MHGFPNFNPDFTMFANHGKKKYLPQLDVPARLLDGGLSIFGTKSRGATFR